MLTDTKTHIVIIILFSFLPKGGVQCSEEEVQQAEADTIT